MFRSIEGTLAGSNLGDWRSVIRLMPHLEKPVVSNGELAGQITGPIGQKLALQVSSDLGDWAELTTVTNASGQVPFRLPLAPQPAQFFRVRVIPRTDSTKEEMTNGRARERDPIPRRAEFDALRGVIQSGTGPFFTERRQRGRGSTA